MTAKRDFKRVVRERMAKTGETYTQARQALIKDTLSRIDELLAEFNKTEGDRIDREHLFIEAANLAATIHTSTREEGTFRKVFWLLPDAQRLEVLENFLTEDGLSTKDLAWALEQRLIYMAVEAMLDILPHLKEGDSWCQPALRNCCQGFLLHRVRQPNLSTG